MDSSGGGKPPRAEQAVGWSEMLGPYEIMWFPGLPKPTASGSARPPTARSFLASEGLATLMGGQDCHGDCDILLGLKEPRCAPALGATVRSLPEAEKWRAKTLVTEISKYQAEWLRRPRGGEQALMSALGYASGSSYPQGGYKVDFSGIAWIDALPSATADHSGNPRSDVDGWQADLINHGLNLPALVALEFELQQGVAVVVDDLDVSLMERPFKFGGPQIVRLSSGEWTLWTKLPFGRLPSAPYANTPDIQQSILDSSPNSTIQQMAAERHLDSGPMEVHCYRQDFNRYGRRLSHIFGGLPTDDVGQIQQLAIGLYQLAQDNDAVEIGGAAGVLISKVKALSSAPGRKLAARRLLLGDPNALMPVTVVAGNRLVFAPRLLFSISVACLNYVPSQQGQSIDERAASTYEQLVCKLSAEAGMVGPKGPPLVSGVFSKQAGDVDVFAWDEKSVYLLECKYKMQPPGGWSQANQAKRIEELESFLAKMEARRALADDRLRANKPIIRDCDGTEISLPAGLLETRSLRSVLVSARFEPRFNPGRHEVVTLVGRALAASVRERLPLARLMPVYEAPGPLPNPAANE